MLKMLLVLMLLLPDVDQSHQFRESQRIKYVTMWAFAKLWGKKRQLFHLRTTSKFLGNDELWTRLAVFV